MTELYIISYEPNGEDAPFFFDLEWMPDLPSFHYPSENPDASALSARYKARADVSLISADWLPDHFLASCEWIKICDSFSCLYISRPVDIYIENNLKTDKKYSFFVPAERLKAMDLEKSSYVADTNSKAKEDAGGSINYERIDSLILKDGIASDLFYFEEIKQVVCSAAFMAGCIRSGISGLKFSKIESDFEYNPWDDF